MQVLFISSSLSNGEPSPIIQSQAHALSEQGMDINYYGLKNKGFIGYFREIFLLKKQLRHHTCHIYHAHYGLSAIVATLAGARPLVVSLMGSDVKEGGWQQFLIKQFAKRRWAATIAKSQELADIVGNKYCKVIPNGVDMDLFKPLSKQQCRKHINLEQDKTYVLFAANPDRPEKNFALAKDAFDNLNLEQAELLYLQNVPHSEIPLWMNAADVVLLTSLWEGSPNVIKEAMSCNRPIVSTAVGDVRMLIDNLSNCYVVDGEVEDFSTAILSALRSKEVKKYYGRQKLRSLQLDSKTVANEIISLYKTVIT